MATDPDYDEALALAEQSLGRVDPSRRTARRLRPRTLKVATGSSDSVPPSRSHPGFDRRDRTVERTQQRRELGGIPSLRPRPTGSASGVGT
jgi:hypothetical protein